MEDSNIHPPWKFVAFLLLLAREYKVERQQLDDVDVYMYVWRYTVILSLIPTRSRLASSAHCNGEPILIKPLVAHSE